MDDGLNPGRGFCEDGVMPPPRSFGSPGVEEVQRQIVAVNFCEYGNPARRYFALGDPILDDLRICALIAQFFTPDVIDKFPHGFEG